ncbi:MAG: nitroreductase family protein [Candidatus Woesearchaeota archaeon]|nr:nitroreductase family protein [Candidatus Woesearchaeota archaeon]
MPYEDIFPLMASRRTCKRFSSQPVETDKVFQIVEAGSLAPNSGNLQNWSFILVTDTDKIRGLYESCLQQEPFLTAMNAIIISADVQHAQRMYGPRGKRVYIQQDAAAAMTNMGLAAEALGLGSCWIGGFDEDAVISMFGIPEHRYRPLAVLLLGYPQEGWAPDSKEQKPLKDLLSFNKFGLKVYRPHLIYWDWATEWKNKGKNIKETSGNWLQRAAGKDKYEDEKKKEPEPEGPSSLDKAKDHMKSVIEKMKRS